MMQLAGYAAASALFGIGLFCVLSNPDMIKICIGMSIMESALVLVLVSSAFRPTAAAPILSETISAYVDPLPHALSLTAIVIGAGVISLALGMTVVVQRRFGTTNLREILERLR
jgi:multicomponent Na+:H+ antiporter subunit C